MYAPAKELENSEAYELMKMIKGAKLEEAVEYVKWVQLPDGQWKMWGSNPTAELDPEFLDRARKQNNIDYKDARVVKNGESPEDSTLTEELWDKSRVTDLVRYYLDRSNIPVNTLANKIRTQMEDEGSKLPFNITDFYDTLYIEIDNYNSQLDESKSIKTLGAKGKKLDESRDPYFTPYGYRDAAKVLNGKAPDYYYHLKEIEMAQGDGKKLANYAKKLGLNVIEDPNGDPDYPEFYIPGQYHWNDYFYPYPSDHEPKLTEDADVVADALNRMEVEVFSGLNADGFAVHIYSADDKLLFTKDYRYGHNASYTRKFAEFADKDYEDSIKYNWKNKRVRKPFIADIINDLAKEYNVSKENIEVIGGQNKFSSNPVDDETVARFKQHMNESADETVKRYQVEFYFDGDDHRTYEYAYAESAQAARNIIENKYPNVTITGCIAETVPAKYKEWDLKESIEVATIADYITDNYEFDDIDDKYGCINSIRDSFKDEETISYEELEQFIGAHNGRDKVNEDIDYSKFRDIPDLIPYEPVEDTRKWQYSVRGVDVPYTSYEDAKAHLKDDYNIEDYREELQTYLDKETGRPQKFFVDATFDGRLVISIHWGDWKHEHNYADFLVRKFFIDKGLGIETDVDVTDEDGSDTYSAEHYYQINDIALSGRVIEEDVDDVQYGVHQFSTDSIIFRGTEEECGKYIDNDKKLWDDAEVYRMTPDDPHYKKMDEAADKPLYIIKDSHGNQLSAPNPDDSELWDRVESMEARGRRGLMVVAYTGKKVNEASYGGAFDIEDDQYFTRDDLLSFADEVLGHVAETFNGQYDIGGVWFEEGCVVTQIVSEDGNMYEDTTKVDMRKIREPWHLTRMYAFPVATNIIQQISDTDGDVITENAIGEGEYSDKFHNYFLFLLNEGKEEELPYLASQLIRYCKEDDLKDLWNDRMEKVAHSNGFEATDEDLQEGLVDGFYKAQRYLELEIPEICRDVVNKLPDMTEKEFDVLNDRCANFHGAMEDMLHYMNAPKTEEALTESVTDAEPIETGTAVGMAAVVSDLIKDEYEAIDGYNSAIATAEAEGFGDAVKVLTEIQAEENIHIGQLQEVMKMFDPNAEKVEEGQAEGAEQLNNSDETPNNNIEESADMKKERWEEIYDSFKTVEKELNQDGEAVTAVVDQMYQDNKDDPDYKKAYDKWASGN